MADGEGGLSGSPSSRAPASARADEAWVTRAVAAPGGMWTCAEALADALYELGAREAWGVVGGGIAPMAEALKRSRLVVRHARHEGGAAFAATEASIASERPVVVFVTTGPGLFNALNGLAAAKWDGARVIVVSGSTSPAQRGRFAVQETSPFTLPMGALHGPSELFDLALELASLEQLEPLLRRLELSLMGPRGVVAHLGLPLSVQTSTLVTSRRARAASLSLPAASPATLSELAELFMAEPFGLWLGFGARHASREVLELCELTGARVIASPRAKGVMPERHPLYVGVSGPGAHPSVEAYLAGDDRPARLLVLGSKLGEATSFWSPALVPRKGFVQVDLEPSVLGASFHLAPVRGVVAEARGFVAALTRELRARGVTSPRELGATSSALHRLAEPPELVASAGRVRPQFLMQAVQRRVVCGSDAVVMAEAGNSFAWATHLLRFDAPGRYRASIAWGSMGHFVAGVVGAALAREGRAVAIVGDGAMLMNNEVSTAVKYGARATWIVLDDGHYGITRHAMRAQGFLPVETELPPTDFVMLARSMGADGARVEHEGELDAALELALSAEGPFVVDVLIDPDEVSPLLARRIASLNHQGAARPRE
jgi:acetolactate synthase-1/2/3 large subunit